jgi:tetratricopeptide (TPR) repeat protein
MTTTMTGKDVRKNRSNVKLIALKNPSKTGKIVSNRSDMTLTDLKCTHLDEIYRIAKQESDQEGREVHVVELLSYYIKLRPEDAKAWMLYGDALRVLGRRDEAHIALTRAFDMAPQEYKGYIASRIAMLAEKHMSPREAEGWYRVATDALGSEVSWPWILRGANLSLLGKFQEAIACFDVVANGDADEKDEALLNLGLVYRAMGEYAKAEEYFLQALAIRSDYEEAQNALLGLKDISETFKLIRKATGAALH